MGRSNLHLESRPRKRKLRVRRSSKLQKVFTPKDQNIIRINSRAKPQVDKSWKAMGWDFPGGPVVKTPGFHCKGHRFDPWSGN